MTQPTEKTAPVRVEDHLGLAHLACRSFRTMVGRGFDYDDLFQAACEGLLRAAESYDPARGAFSTHAVPLCRRFVKRHVARHARTVRVPEYAQDDAAAAGKTPSRPATGPARGRRLAGAPFDWSSPGASLSGPALVATTLVPYAGVPSTWSAAEPQYHAPSAERSLDYALGQDADTILHDVLADDASPTAESLLTERERREWWRHGPLCRALVSLSDREFDVLTERLGGRTQPALAAELGVTKARIHQIEAAAVAKVRASLARDEGRAQKAPGRA